MYCNCNTPTIIKNEAAGEPFDYCTTCKKEHSVNRVAAVRAEKGERVVVPSSKSFLELLHDFQKDNPTKKSYTEPMTLQELEANRCLVDGCMVRCITTNPNNNFTVGQEYLIKGKTFFKIKNDFPNFWGIHIFSNPKYTFVICSYPVGTQIPSGANLREDGGGKIKFPKIGSAC